MRKRGFTMSEITVNGVSLFFEEKGSGPETIVFSHGYLLDSTHFAPQIEALSDWYRCIAYDHRGHGRSQATKDGYDMENLYADAVGLIETLNCAPCHFVGLSTGGFIGVRIAIRRPELLSSLILMDTTAEAEPEKNVKQYKLLMPIVRWLGWWPVINKVMSLSFAEKFLTDPGRQDEVRYWKELITSGNKKALIQFGMGIFSRTSVFEALSTITTPTLVMVGEKDTARPLSEAQRTVEKIHGAKLVIIPEAAHLCTIEEPAAVTEAIEEFLNPPLVA
jgi:3-oxoadipate enol-lactonase